MSADRFENESFLFVTGRLAAHALHQVVRSLADQLGFSYTVQVLPITVAALMTPKWIASRLTIPPGTTQIIIPGYCGTNIEVLRRQTEIPVHVGPRDLWDLPHYFGQRAEPNQPEPYNIQIVAEINHAPQMAISDLVDMARQLRDAGADLIDVGCEPGGGWLQVGEAVRALREAGLRVSIDSLDPTEIAAATQAGAELVLSVNSSNRAAAPDWGCEVVAIPDVPTDLASLHETVEFLAEKQVPLRIDPIIEPIGCGFAASLTRYAQVREHYPDAEMLMGIGNLTEMTDADSAAINLLLLGFCQELGIHSVLTTQVINWARTSVQECDIARRLVYRAVQQATPPKNMSDLLVMLRDPRIHPIPDEFVRSLATSIRDHHVRVLADEYRLHMLSADVHASGVDPFEVFRAFLDEYPRELDAAHAFYLGYEMAKATTARTLGKQYTQDEALRWGYLTQPESSHRSEEG